MAHVIGTWTLAGRPDYGFQGARGKCLSALRAMRELDTLYIARKHDRVIAHNGSAAKRMDSDLTARPLADLALPPVDCRLVKVSATACRGGLRKHERCS